MADVSGANIRIGATADGAVSELNRLRSQFALFSRELNSNVTASYANASKANTVFRKGLTQLGTDLTSIGAKMALITGLPTLFAGRQAYKDYAEVQRLERGLSQYGETLEKVRRLAKEPNIGVFDGSKALIGLRAARIESELAERAVRSFANAITLSGGNSADLEPALFNLKQFKATQNINQVDLRQLANRIPQTMEVIERAFGTIDVSKLNQLGTDKFIEGFITELEKLPKVAGGASVAMEQLSDSATFFSAAFGESLDRTFDISGKISSLGGILDNLSVNFKALNPEAQKSIVWMTSLGVAVPILVTGIGVLTLAFQRLAVTIAVGGLAALPISTIIAAGVAIAALGASIGGLISLYPLLTDRTSEYKKQQEELNNTAPKLGPLIEKYDQLKKASDPESQKQLKQVIGEIAGLVPSAATAWDKYGKAIDINKGKVTSFIGELRKAMSLMEGTRRASLVEGNVRDAQRAEELKRQLQTGTRTTTLNQGMGVYTQYTERMSPAELRKTAEELAGISARLMENRKELLQMGSGTILKDVNAFVKIQEERNRLAMQLKELQSDGWISTNDLAKINSLRNRIHALDEEIKKQRKSVNDAVKEYNTAKAEARDVRPGRATSAAADTETKSLSQQSTLTGEVLKKQQALSEETGRLTKLELELYSINLAKKYYEDVEAIKRATQEYKELTGVVAGFNLKLLESQKMSGGIGTGNANREASYKNASERLAAIGNSGTKGYLRNDRAERIENAELTEAFRTIRQQEGESLEDYKDRVQDIVQVRRQANEQITASIRQTGGEAATAFGELLGNLINGENALESFRAKVLSILGSLLKDIGKSLVSLGLAGEAFKFFKDKPALAIAAGIGLTAAGQAVSNSAQKKVTAARFAKGGAVYSEIPAIIGDNPNARFDPEIVAPYSKVHNSLRQSIKEFSGNRFGNGNDVVATAVVKGNDLVFLIKQVQTSQKGLRAHG